MKQYLAPLAFALALGCTLVACSSNTAPDVTPTPTAITSPMPTMTPDLGDNDEDGAGGTIPGGDVEGDLGDKLEDALEDAKEHTEDMGDTLKEDVEHAGDDIKDDVSDNK